MKIFIAIAALLLLQCCHHDDPNPCTGLLPTMAGFTIKEWVNKAIYAWPDWQDYNTDTVTNNVVVLTANQDSTAGTTYTWTIGANTYNRRSFTIDFSARDTAREKSVPITLSVSAQPNKTCFPTDSGKATFTKNIVFANQTLTAGKYFGVWNKNSADTATVIIYGYFKVQTFPGRPVISGVSPDSLPGFVGWNLVGDHVIGFSQDTYGGYKEFLSSGDGFRPWYVSSYNGLIHDYALSGRLYPDNNTIEIKVSRPIDGINKTFNGKRVN